MTFSLLRRLAGTRGLARVYEARHSGCFSSGAVCTWFEPRLRAVLRRRIISGP